LAILEALGAVLPADFTSDELRAAFRSLARRYHPDRHPRCSEDERIRLGVLFGHAHDAYRTLSRI
jgi:DnaJ-class molecular chaperone